jgi:hypothetical protein
MIRQIPDWNGEPLGVGYSRGGVLAIADVRRALIWRGEWPPSMLKRKLKRSRHARAFDDQTRSHLERSLGYYCDLQSIRSEDAITWSFFGTLVDAPDDMRALVLNWLLEQCGLVEMEATASVELWKRLPHPNTGRTAHGPEPDFSLLGDRAIILGEAKWGSAEDTTQGVLGDQTQMDMRRDSLLRIEHDLRRRLHKVALGIVLTETLEPPPPDTEGMRTRILEWTHLADCPYHPLRDEFSRYYRWKLEHTKSR